MRFISIANHKTGQSVEVPIDTLPARALVPEPLPTQGIEVELPLFDAHTMAPAPAPMVLQLFGQDSWRTPETPAHCCEVKTEPHRAAGELLSEYRARAGWLCRWAESRGLLVVPLATDPMVTLCAVNPSGFIRQLTDCKYGIATMAVNHSMCTQVNTHVADGDALLALYQGLIRIAPVLAGMFANSPFSSGRRAGVLSYRHVVRRVFLNGGDPEHLPRSLHWEAYLKSHQALTAMGTWFPVLFALNGVIRLRPDRMCVESGVTDLIAEPRHLAGLLELSRRAAYRILCAYRDGDSLPWWFGPDDEAVRDAAFRVSMLSAVKLGSKGLCCTSELRPAPIGEVFAALLSWVGEAGIPDDPSLPWSQAEAGLRDLLDHGSPAERLMRTLGELHRDCQDPVTGCPGCPAHIVEVCRRHGRAFHAQLSDGPAA